jgi:Fur family ferric uptake transcriptional regulator
MRRRQPPARETAQRRAIRETFAHAERPLSPPELWKSARRKAPTLGLATVYRAISALVDEGWLQSVFAVGAPPRYEPAGKSHHHHFQCRKCGKIYDVPGCTGDVRALTPAGFRLEDHEFTLYGRCAACVGGER